MRHLADLLLLLSVRSYASLYFVFGCDKSDNELIILETIHKYVLTLDRYFENVCELDIIYGFDQAYFILDEFVMAGEVQETSIKAILKHIYEQNMLEKGEVRALDRSLAGARSLGHSSLTLAAHRHNEASLPKHSCRKASVMMMSKRALMTSSYSSVSRQHCPNGSLPSPLSIYLSRVCNEAKLVTWQAWMHGTNERALFTRRQTRRCDARGRERGRVSEPECGHIYRQMQE